MSSQDLSKTEYQTNEMNTDFGWSFQNVLNNIDIGIIIVDTEHTRIDFCNPVSLEILQKRNRELTYAALTQVLLHGTSFDSIVQLGHSTHTVQHGSKLHGFSIYPISTCHYCILIRDITEKSRLESIAQAVNTMDNIGFIFSGIRHEIGNPLNSIKMTISVLRKNLRTFSKDVIRAYIERTADEVTRMEYLLKSLKNFSMFEKIDAGEHDLGVFLERYLELVKRDFERKGIEVEMTSIPYGVKVSIDPRALQQALLNIFANAADALAGRSRPSIHLQVQSNGSLAWLKIEDNGCGMTEIQQRQLFQPFSTTKDKGNGLGLVITQKLLAKMNASIEIRSTEAIGTVVRIALPLVTAADLPEPAEQ